MRTRIRSLLSAAAVAAPLSAAAASPPCPACRDCPEVAPAPRPVALATKVFAVMDLVTPIPYSVTPAPAPVRPTPTATPTPTPIAHPFPTGPMRVVPPTPAGPVVQAGYVPPPPTAPPAVPDTGAKRRENATKLVRLVKTVRPDAWREAGGPATAEYFDNGGALVVHGSPALLAEVEEMFAALRKLQGVCVVVETRVLTVPARFEVERLFAEDAEDGQPAFLTDVQVGRLIEQAQGDRRANVKQLPKVTLFSGQTADVVCGETAYFTTALDEKQVNGTPVMVPRTEAVQLGLTARLTATASADKQSVKLGVKLGQARVDGPVPLLPVTSVITPVFEGGSKGTPIPFTQFIQQPKVERNTVEATVSLPAGGTVALAGGKQVVETRTESGPPVLSRVPYLNRLFRNVGIHKEEMDTVVLVTARVIVTDEAQAGGPAGELVAAYRKAVAAGRHDEAVRLAIQALAADPGCFATVGK